MYYQTPASLKVDVKDLFDEEVCRGHCHCFTVIPQGPKYLYGAKYGFCSSNFPHGSGK